jgi:phosphate transport system permease protein
MLGLARAAGETMLANEFAEASSEIHRSALVEVALILLLMSLLFNVVARYLVVGKNARSAAAH